jgi:hypothetical protein
LRKDVRGVGTLSELGGKIRFLCEKVEIDVTFFRKQIAKVNRPPTPYYIRGDKIDAWLEGRNDGKDKEPTLKRLRLYWRTVHQIHIPDHYFYLPTESFIREMTKTQKFAEAFLTSYQILRPFQNDPSSYAAEVLEISSGDRGIVSSMYSHNFTHSEELYEGRASIAKRYYFSMLSRPHEDGSANSAFRCITFFISDELKGRNTDFLFGLMLRGVSGKKADAKDYAVAVPFLAIPQESQFSLAKMATIDLRPDDDENKIYRLHKNGPILVGLISKLTSEILYEFCRGIFEDTRLREALFEGSPLVLHTIARNKIKHLNISAKSWKSVVEKAFPTGR